MLKNLGSEKTVCWPYFSKIDLELTDYCIWNIVKLELYEKENILERKYS